MCCVSACEQLLSAGNSKLYKSTAGKRSLMERMGLLTKSSVKREDADFDVAVDELLEDDCGCGCLAAIADSEGRTPAAYFSHFRTMLGTAGTSHTEQNGDRDLHGPEPVDLLRERGQGVRLLVAAHLEHRHGAEGCSGPGLAAGRAQDGGAPQVRGGAE